MRGARRSKRFRVWDLRIDLIENRLHLCDLLTFLEFAFPNHLHFRLQAVETSRCLPNFEASYGADLYSGRGGWGQEIFVHKNQIEDGRELNSFIGKP